MLQAFFTTTFGLLRQGKGSHPIHRPAQLRERESIWDYYEKITFIKLSSFCRMLEKHLDLLKCQHLKGGTVLHCVAKKKERSHGNHQFPFGQVTKVNKVTIPIPRITYNECICSQQKQTVLMESNPPRRTIHQMQHSYLLNSIYLFCYHCTIFRAGGNRKRVWMELAVCSMKKTVVEIHLNTRNSMDLTVYNYATVKMTFQVYAQPK